MFKVKYLMAMVLFVSCSTLKNQASKQIAYKEAFRPQIHFSPKAHWMNDPNGMVYDNGTYHLFFQYFPDSNVWGPMHWGHAISKDLVHWQQQPIALYPDSLGYIFSGSAVVDKENTSGFGKNGKAPIVAIFTQHNPMGEKAGRNDFQNQSIAYSIDEGKTWTKYPGNPVLKNPGLRDFRDPKVSWYEPGKKWIMTLATMDRVTFYSSKDLKTWKKESEFGKEVGAHGGVWECPDLFTLEYKGKTIWVLLVSINPGGPNGGSATQYFTGQFDGKTFVPFQKDTRWIDYGPDDYAGVTWSNTGNRKIFMGWMSNWQYANLVPSYVWRGANTIPRELSIEKVNDRYLLTSQPVKELNILHRDSIVLNGLRARDYDLTAKTGNLTAPAQLEISFLEAKSFSIQLSNEKGEQLIVGYDEVSDNYYINRNHSGIIDFEKGFAGIHTAPRLCKNENLDMTLIIDNTSIELFADKGLSVMTEIFFPHESYSHIQIQSRNIFEIQSLKITGMKSIWK